MSKVKTLLTQEEQLQQAFIRIAPDITAEDREIVINKLSISKQTISTYLNGNIHSLDTAVKILTILRKRVAARQSLINTNQ